MLQVWQRTRCASTAFAASSALSSIASAHRPLRQSSSSSSSAASTSSPHATSVCLLHSSSPFLHLLSTRSYSTPKFKIRSPFAHREGRAAFDIREAQIKATERRKEKESKRPNLGARASKKIEGEGVEKEQIKNSNSKFKSAKGAHPNPRTSGVEFSTSSSSVAPARTSKPAYSHSKRAGVGPRHLRNNPSASRNTDNASEEIADEQPDSSPAAVISRENAATGKSKNAMKREQKRINQPQLESDFWKTASQSGRKHAKRNSNQHTEQSETMEHDNISSAASSDSIDTLPRDRLQYDPTPFLNAETFAQLRIPPHVSTKLPLLIRNSSSASSTPTINRPTPVQKHAIPFLMHAPFFTERLKGRDASESLVHTTRLIRSQADADGLTARRKAARMKTPRDALIQDMTGSGKTLAYAIPMLSAIDNFSKHTQGIIIVPTRELAVQIFRIFERLNTVSSGGKNKKRRAHPVKIELCVGTVTPEYAEQVRRHKPHIVIGTPKTMEKLIMPSETVAVTTDKQHAHSLQAIPLQHLRMFVLDEIDHLLLPFSGNSIERILQYYTSSRTHGALRRMGRIVTVSAAITERVYGMLKKWLNRPVTITSEGLLDGFVSGEKRLLDKFYFPREYVIESERVAAEAKKQEDAAKAAAIEVNQNDVEEIKFDDDEDDDEDDLSPFADLSINPLPRAKVDFSQIDAEIRAEYEEADAIFTEEEDEVAEMLAIRAMKKVDGEDVDDDEVIDEPQLKVEEAQSNTESPSSSFVSADTFRLPGSQTKAPPVAVTLAMASTNSTEFDPTAAIDSDTAGAQFPDDDHSDDPASSLPLASSRPIRYLPSTMHHINVSVPPSIKLSHKKAHSGTELEQQQALQNKLNLLSKLHSILKPRVALVFFNNSREAVELSEALLKEKKIRSELLVTNARLTVKQKIKALRTVQMGRCAYLFVTDHASRGLDIEGLTHVINWNLPKASIDYIHRAGRVERLGGRHGCTIVNIVSDNRINTPAQKGSKKSSDDSQAPIKQPDHQPILYQQWTTPYVRLLDRIQAQLHILDDVRRVYIKSGEFIDFVPKKTQDEVTEEGKNTKEKSLD